MRPKVVFILLLPALLVLAAVIFLKRHSSPAPETAITTVATNVAPTLASVPMFVPVPMPAPTPAAKIMTPEERQAVIDAEKDHLSEWQMNSDSQSLSNILADLSSPEKEIRMAAIEAAKQFDDTNAIPALKAAVDNTDDTEEKIALLKAADFLSLPDVTFGNTGDSQTAKTPEQIQADEQNNERRQARLQAQLQNHRGQNQNAQSVPLTTSSGTAPGN
jgi:hypothetical protein